MRHGFAGRWWRFVPQHQWPQDPESTDAIMKNWSEASGDCRQGIAFIGQDIDFAQLAAFHVDCLLTDDEMALGVRGQALACGSVRRLACRGRLTLTGKSHRAYLPHPCQKTPTMLQNIPTHVHCRPLWAAGKKTSLIKHLMAAAPGRRALGGADQRVRPDTGLDAALLTRDADGIALGEVAGGCLCCVNGAPFQIEPRTGCCARRSRTGCSSEPFRAGAPGRGCLNS